MHTAEKNLEVVRGLIDQANAATGNTDTDLTSAVSSLVAGFGQGENTCDGVAEEFLSHVTSYFNTFINAAFPTGYEMVFPLRDDLTDASIWETFKNATGIKQVTFKRNSEEKLKLALYRGFQYCKSIEVVDFSEIPNWYTNDFRECFSSCTSLREIKGIVSVTTGYETGGKMNNTFQSCSKLEEIRFTPLTIAFQTSFANSPLLSDASIQSIIDGLADLTGATAQTLTLNSTVKAKLTEEQIANITNKNWTLA